MAESLCEPGPDTICRANLDLMPPGTALWMYILTALGFLVFAYGVWQMVRVWRLGRSWTAGPLWPGMKRFGAAIMSHSKFRQDPKPGTGHAWIFFGFLALFITTAIVAIDADFFELILGKKLLQGGFYLLLEAFADAFGVLFVVGLAYMMWRRYVQRPKQLHETKPVEARALRFMDADMYALVFLLAVGVTGFLLEAIRIAHQQATDGIQHAGWSFVGAALAGGFQSWSPARMEVVYRTAWWTHFALWTSVLAMLPWTKLRHILTSSLNIIFSDPERQARPELAAPFDLRQVMASETMEMPQVGVSTIRDFTWKDRLAFDACTNCGRCEAQCPADAAGRPLSPRKLIQDLKEHMWDDARAGKDHQSVPLTQVRDFSAQIDETTLWSCTTCRACVTACPVDINHVDLIVDMRRALVNDSKLDEHQSKLLVNLTNAGNPYGFAAADRDDWTNGLPGGIVVPRAAEKVARGETVDVLWWIGCSGSFDPRNQEVTKSIATILNAAGVDFAILGSEERCTADPARRLGEEGRFQQSVLENLAVLDGYGPKTVITQCPHCFNTLRNEYPKFAEGDSAAASWDVIHHGTFIERLIEEGRLPLTEGADMQITYHDSCYLGRHNGIFDAPRNVLEKTTGLPPLEMSQSKETGLCCGAGGANMWYEVKDEDERINVIRAKQAAETGAGTVATACPFCLTMMTDGLSLTGNDDKGMLAQDLAEIVAAHLDWQPPEVDEPVEAPADTAGGVVWVG